MICVRRLQFERGFERREKSAVTLIKASKSQRRTKMSRIRREEVLYEVLSSSLWGGGCRRPIGKYFSFSLSGCSQDYPSTDPTFHHRPPPHPFPSLSSHPCTRLPKTSITPAPKFCPASKCFSCLLLTSHSLFPAFFIAHVRWSGKQ